MIMIQTGNIECPIIGIPFFGRAGLVVEGVFFLNFFTNFFFFFTVAVDDFFCGAESEMNALERRCKGREGRPGDNVLFVCQNR